MWYCSDTGADNTSENRSHKEPTQLRQPQIHMLKSLQETTRIRPCQHVVSTLFPNLKILSRFLILKVYTNWFSVIERENILDLMHFLLKHCFGEIVILTFLRLDCSHFNQSLSWLTFLLGLKKKKEEKKLGAVWDFASHSRLERKVEELWKPQKAHSTHTSQALWQYNTQIHTVSEAPPQTAAAGDRGSWCLWTWTETQSPKKAPPKSRAKSLGHFSHWQSKSCVI